MSPGADDQWLADHGAAFGGNFAKTAEAMKAKIAAEPKKAASGEKAPEKKAAPAEKKKEAAPAKKEEKTKK